MSGILVIQSHHCAGGAARIDHGFTEKKNPEKISIFQKLGWKTSKIHWKSSEICDFHQLEQAACYGQYGST